MTKTISIANTTLELVERGHGRPLLFLHPGEGLAPEKPWLELLSRRYQVFAPWHPGYGNSPLIDGSGSIDDVAYLYLDLAAELKLENAVLVGACFGGAKAGQSKISEPNPYHARNRKFESISLQRRVACKSPRKLSEGFREECRACPAVDHPVGWARCP